MTESQALANPKFNLITNELYRIYFFGLTRGDVNKSLTLVVKSEFYDKEKKVKILYDAKDVEWDISEFRWTAQLTKYKPEVNLDRLRESQVFTPLSETLREYSYGGNLVKIENPVFIAIDDDGLHHYVMAKANELYVLCAGWDYIRIEK